MAFSRLLAAASAFAFLIGLVGLLLEVPLTRWFFASAWAAAIVVAPLAAGLYPKRPRDGAARIISEREP